MTKTFEERIDALEQYCIANNMHTLGTTLSRVVDTTKDNKLMWTIGIGGLGQPKRWFTAETIDGVLHLAEQELLVERKTARTVKMRFGRRTEAP